MTRARFHVSTTDGATVGTFTSLDRAKRYAEKLSTTRHVGTYVAELRSTGWEPLCSYSAGGMHHRDS